MKKVQALVKLMELFWLLKSKGLVLHYFLFLKYTQLSINHLRCLGELPNPQLAYLIAIWHKYLSSLHDTSEIWGFYSSGRIPIAFMYCAVFYNPSLSSADLMPKSVLQIPKKLHLFAQPCLYFTWWTEELNGCGICSLLGFHILQMTGITFKRQSKRL